VVRALAREFEMDTVFIGSQAILITDVTRMVWGETQS
jgi:hypothetical protein